MLLPDDHPAVVRDVAKRAKRRLQVSSTHLGLMLFFHMCIFSFVSMWPLYVYTHPIPRKPDPKLKWIARHRTWAKDKEVRKFDCVESVSKTSSLGVFGSDKFAANVGRLISKRWTKKDFLPRSTQKLLNKSRATERWRLVSQCVCFFDSNCVCGLVLSPTIVHQIGLQPPGCTPWKPERHQHQSEFGANASSGEGLAGSHVPDATQAAVFKNMVGVGCCY